MFTFEIEIDIATVEEGIFSFLQDETPEEETPEAGYTDPYAGYSDFFSALFHY